MQATDRFGGLSSRSVWIIVAATIAGLLHHTDHVLRVDHSGWPFRPDVNPFTYSLLAYPIIAFALFGPARLFWLRWALFLVGTVFTIGAHTLLETPEMQYTMWAHDRSLEPQFAQMHNLPDVHSALTGVVAVVVAMALNILLVAGVASILVDGLRRADRDRLIAPRI